MRARRARHGECVEQVVGPDGDGQGPADEVGGRFGVGGVDAYEACVGDTAGEVFARPSDDARGVESGAEFEDEQAGVGGGGSQPVVETAARGEIGGVDELGTDTDVDLDLAAAVRAAGQGTGDGAGGRVVRGEELCDEGAAVEGGRSAGDGALVAAVVALRGEDPVGAKPLRAKRASTLDVITQWSLSPTRDLSRW